MKKITRFLPILALAAIVAGAIYMKSQVSAKAASQTAVQPVMVESVEPAAAAPAEPVTPAQ